MVNVAIVQGVDLQRLIKTFQDRPHQGPKN